MSGCSDSPGSRPRFSLVRIVFLAMHWPVRSSNSSAAQALAIDHELRSSGAAHEVSSGDNRMTVSIKVIGIQGYIAVCLHNYSVKPCIAGILIWDIDDFTERYLNVRK